MNAIGMSAGRALLAGVVVALLTVPAAAQAKRNLYVSSGASSPDGVAAFDFAADGSISAVPGSPFAAGGSPSPVALTPDGRRLYTAIAGPPTGIAGFDVSASSGALIPIAGSPFADTGSPQSLAITPDGRYLLASHLAGSDAVSVFSIGAAGALSPVPGSPFATGGAQGAVVVTPDGSHAYVGSFSGTTIAAFDIGAGGTLTSVAGSPFEAGGASLRDLAVTPDGRNLYATNVGGGGTVSAFEIGDDGGLTAVSGSPFAAGLEPVGASIAPDGAHLYVSNQSGDSISGYDIAAGGMLAPLAGSPFATSTRPTGLSVTSNGRRLYVAHQPPTGGLVAGFDLAANGSPAAVPGSPFSTIGLPPADSLAITPNQGPTAAFSTAVAPPEKPTAFDAGASSDPDGTVARYDWDFGDGTSLPNGGPAPTHTYERIGTYTVTLTVTDNEGCFTEQVFTGQTAYCNGGPGARMQQRLDLVPPDLLLGGRRFQPLDAAIEVSALCTEPCALTATGRLTVTTPVGKKSGGKGGRRKKRRRYRLRGDETQAGAREGATLKLRPIPVARRAAARAFGRHGKVTASITVTAADATGNPAVKKFDVKLQPLRRPRA